MRFFSAALITVALVTTASAQEPRPFTLQQILSAPYASLLTAAPVGPLFAWTEDAEGRHNLFVGGKDVPARQLTHNTEDDAQDISQLAWSPDAKFIAYTFGAPSGADGKPANPAHLQRLTTVNVIVQPLDVNTPLLNLGEGRAPLFTRDGHGLLFLRAGQIWITCLKQCHPEGSTLPLPPPFQLVYDRGSASSLTLSPDGRWLAFISRRREANEPSHSFLALFDLRNKRLTFPAPSTGNDSAPAFSPDGKQLAWLRSPFTDFPEFANPRTSATPWSVQLMSLADGTAKTLYSPEPNKPGSVLPDQNQALFFNAFGRVLFVSEADGWAHLYYLDPADGKPQSVREGDYEVESPTMALNGKRVVFTTNSEAYESFGIRAMQVHMGSSGWTSDAIYEADAYRLLDHLVTIDVGGKLKSSQLQPVCCRYAAHPQINSDDTLAALLSDERHPMAPAIYRAEQDQTRFISLRPNLPATFPAESLVTPTPVIFPSTDNLQIHSQLFLPKNLDPHKKHPAILFLHGGPMRQMLLGYPAMDYYSNAYAMNQYLTSRGFIVLSVNYRCGIGYGLNFHQCEGEGATGAKEYDDVLAAQKYLASRPDVDAKRIGLWGGSYGGYLTALGLARNSDLFAAGVDFHGVHDWNLEDNASDWKQGSFAQQDAIAARALASSPLGDIGKWRSPVLLIHGDNDPDVAYAQTPHLADALRARNSRLPSAQQVDVQELIFPDELHGFLLHRDWLAAYTAAAEFFERILKPTP